MRRILILAVILAAWMRPTEADLPGYDDAYYARKALEVVRSGEWLALPFNGSPTFDNPPLGIWAQAIAFKIVGASDAAARLPTALFGVLLIWLAFEWGRGVLGERWAGFVLAALILCNPLFLKYLRRGMLDVGLLFWSLAGVFLAQRKPLSRPMHALSGVAFGMAYLTKSVLGLIGPVSLVVGWAFAGQEGRWRLKHWRVPAAGGFTLVAGTWLGVMVAKFGSPFVNGHFIWLLFGEGIAGVSDSGRIETIGRLFVLLLPVSAVFLAALAGPLRERFVHGGGWENLSVPLAWSWVPLILLLAVGPRKLWYFIAVLPGTAAIAAAGVCEWTRSRRAWRRTILNTTILGGCALALVVISLPVPLHRDRTEVVRAIAAEVRARTTPETAISLYFPGESCRWDVRNAFLWYADRPLEGCSSSPDRAAPSVGQHRRWVLTSRAGLDQLRSRKRSVLVWVHRGDLVLASQEPA